MSKKVCSHPTCYESEESTTMYKEETKRGDKGSFVVCGSHVSEVKAREGKVTVIMNDAASAANAAVLSGIDRIE